MQNAFLTKLSHGADLTVEDQAVLVGGLTNVRKIEAGRDIVRDGDEPDDVRLILDGVACRYKMISNSSRSIMAFLMPGDFCDLHVAILGRMDHALSALTPCRVANIPRRTIETWTENHPRINRALWWATLVDEGVLRAWLANIGGRRSPERIAHLFCELRLRLETVGLATAGGFELPLTQQQLGEATGLSVVHVNRTLNQLRKAGLVTFRAGRVFIPDIERLGRMAGFDPGYLHLEGSARRGGMTGGEKPAPALETNGRNL